MPFIQVNGIRVYFEWHGRAEAPVLVLNNGILMNAAGSWAFQTKTLARHYRLLQYDCRGQGQSDHPDQPYSMALHAEDLAALLDALKIEQAHIAGISYGGEVAQAFALAHPGPTLSLILADTVSEVGAELRATIEAWRDIAKTAEPETFFAVTAPWNFSPEFIRENAQLLAEARKRYKLLDYSAVVRLCEAFLELDLTARLPEIKAPVCLIVGEKDILKGIEYAHLLKARLPQAELHVLPGAGHASCWERPQEFNSVVLGFLAKQIR
jgi:pimeloyl-ACP methyl ester carboxylesterase